MLKKIVCLALAVLLVLPALVACNKGNSNPTDAASKLTTTINLWLITESKLVADASNAILQGTTPDKVDRALEKQGKSQTPTEDELKALTAYNAMSAEQQAALRQVYGVSEAFNKITKARFKTQVNLKYFTEETYYDAVEAAFVKYEAELKANNGVLPQDQVGADDTVTNEYGIPELKYPKAHDFSVDILYMGSYSKYTQYVNNKWLVSLNAMLEDSALKLVSEMSNELLQAAQRTGLYYAFPNNHTIGEYVYLLADEELMSNYGDLSGSTIYDTEFQRYLDYINTTYADEGEKIYPIYSESGKVDIDYTHYWSFDIDESGVAIQKPGVFSLYGDNVGGKSSIFNNTSKSVLGNNNLLTDANYMKQLAAKVHYEQTDGYMTTDSDAKAAVRIVRGGYEMRAKYEAEGYRVLTMQYPQLTDDEVYGSMFGVGICAGNSTERCSEVLTALNTDAELRNILLYGVENENYTFETTEVNGKDYRYVTPTEHNIYQMDVSKTGNEFIAYPDSPDKVLTAEYGKEQNLQVVVYPSLSLYLDTVKNVLDVESVRIMKAVSAAVKIYLDENMKSSADVTSLYSVASNYKRDSQAMAEFLLGLIGEVVYTSGDAQVVVTADKLAAAIDSTGTETLDAKNASVYALYLEWCQQNDLSA